MNREYKEKLSRKIEKNYLDLEERILQDIVRRIRKTGKITSTADYQINRLIILGNSTEDIEKMIKEALGASYPEMFELYDQIINWEYVRNKDIYEQINQRFIPFEENEQLQQITEALVQQTKSELENITQSLGFYLDYGNGRRVLTPLAQVYQGYLDAAMMDIVSGAFDYNSVLRRVVTQLANSGLRTIDYASGRSNRVEVAARRAVMTGITQLTGKISDMNAEKLGTEYFEVAWHEGARPTHQEWQGKVYTREQLVTVCGLGTVTGLEGINCYHERYPFFPGLSERNWSDEWLEAKNREENTPKKFNGKEYTLYEAKQQQRRMETAMRAQREKVDLLRKGGADPDEVMLARCKYQGQLNEYAQFSKKMGLKQERERIYMDMRGRVAPSQHTYKKWQEEQLQKKIKREAEKARREEKARQKAAANDTIKNKRETIQELNKLKQSGMDANEYAEYLNMLNTHRNVNVTRLYKKYADNINSVRKTGVSGVYYPDDNKLDFTYPKYDDMNKYGTLAHEYGHFFDAQVSFSELTFKEMEAVRKVTGLDRAFLNVASSSDAFLAAMRKDKDHIKGMLTAEAKADLAANNASSGVQDAIDGLFVKARIRWGHGEKYYNRKYSVVESMDRITGGTRKKDLQQVYKELGLDASNQAKTKAICRQYEAASEAWANIISAEVCGGKELEYVKKYLPNSYEAMLEILKGVN